MTKKAKNDVTFPFLKYVKAGWYFTLLAQGEDFSTLFYKPGESELPGVDQDFLKTDELYTSQAAKNLDVGFRAVTSGIMLKGNKSQQFTQEDKITLKDNYVFLRKYYAPRWSMLALIRRLLSLKNPVREIAAFNYARKAKYNGNNFAPVEYKDYKDFKSSLVESNPKVSVIIPTLNRYKYLRDVLNDLEAQDYKNFEVILVDQTDTPDKDFYKEFNLDMQLIFQEGKGQWLARNAAIRAASGDFLLFFDDDSRVAPDWISEHLKGLDFFKADISAGVSISTVGQKVPFNYSFFRWADQFDSGNALVKREVFEKIGMFDRQFDKMRMGDGEFGLRAYLYGFKSISHPYARRLHLKVSSGGLRQMGSWDGFRPKKIFAPRPVPSVVYLYRKYFDAFSVRNVLLIGMLPALVPYKWKHRTEMYPLSALLALFVSPVLLIQLAISWHKASKMLKEGDKIEWFD